MIRRTRKTVSSIAIALPMILSACGSSASPATLTASDIDVSLACGGWRPNSAGLGEVDCDVSFTNKSAASGTIYISWDWKDGNKSCGQGYSTGSDGQPGYINFGANDYGTQSTVFGMSCSLAVYNPVAENIRVRVIS